VQSNFRLLFIGPPSELYLILVDPFIGMKDT